MAFSVDLPTLLADDLATAYTLTGRKGLGAGSYTAPGGEACYFIVEKTKLGGGQSLDTPEFPFQGGWSNRSLNRKVQTFSTTVSIVGKDYMVRRNKLAAALDVPTDDDAPGYLELPSWGRIPVVVEDWDIEETVEKQRLTTLTLSFRRKGMSATARVTEAAKDATLAKASVLASATTVKTTACAHIADTLTSTKLSTNMLVAAYSAIKTRLSEIVARIQATKSTIASISAEVQTLVSLIDQGVTAPKALTLAMFGALEAIASSVIGLLADTEDLFSSSDEDEVLVNTDRNALAVVTAILATDTDLGLETGSARDVATLAAVTAAYQTGLFAAAAMIIPSAETVRTSRARALYAMLCDLEGQIDRTNSDLYLACANLRSAVNTALGALELSQDKTKAVARPVPLLSLAQGLAVDPDDLDSLNDFEDRHVIRGTVTYV